MPTLDHNRFGQQLSDVERRTIIERYPFCPWLKLCIVGYTSRVAIAWRMHLSALYNMAHWGSCTR